MRFLTNFSANKFGFSINSLIILMLLKFLCVLERKCSLGYFSALFMKNYEYSSRKSE